jgi:hypothetical protein
MVVSVAFMLLHPGVPSVKKSFKMRLDANKSLLFLDLILYFLELILFIRRL